MRPWQILPVPYPKDFDPSKEQPDYFYQNFVKHFIPDMIQMTSVGLNIDQQAVEELRNTIDTVLESVSETLENNTLIKEYQEHTHPYLVKEYKDKVLGSVRTVEHYVKEYNPKNITHRTYVVNNYVENKKVHEVKSKWTISDIKKLNTYVKEKFLSMIIDGSVSVKNKFVVGGMLTMAKDQSALWNKPRYEKSDIPVEIPKFNPGSNKQLQEFFELLKVSPITVSKKTGNASWNRDNIELLYKISSDKKLLEVLQAVIDHSFSGIIRNNFLAAFDNFTVDGVLYGNIKLFGAKSFRNTSNGPNLLNMPSSRSIYAKPLKRCFTAPCGYIVYAIDYSALEDRVIANLSDDKNKQNIFLENLDGHSLNACGYFPKEIAKVLGENKDNVAYVKEFYRLVEDEKHPILSKIRFISKAPTFKLAYGGYPDASKGGVITQDIFDNYHNVLYPSITKYREEYVLPFAKKNGYVHLGLGCKIYSNEAESHIRTLHNATCQFWSILSLITVNEINYQIRKEGLEEQIKVCSTIYDSIYFVVKEEAEVIKWLNNILVPIMNSDYLVNAPVGNECVGEIGKNWSDLHTIKNNASIEEINKVMEKINK
jgi:DNA polymerase I-like protein with 3'-5' exonuclease and polymerase domains